MGIIKASTGYELTSGVTDRVWSDYEGNVMLAPINNIIPDPEFKRFEALDNALRYWNLLSSPAITNWVVFARDESVQKRFSKQLAGSIPLSTDVFDIRDELIPGASPLDPSETIDVVAPASPIVTPVQVSTVIGLPAGWYTMCIGWILDEAWDTGKRLTGPGRPSQPFQLAQGQGLQFEPPTEIPANVFGLMVYLPEPQATAQAARDATVFYGQARYSVRDLPRPTKILGPYEARELSAGNKTFVGAKASLATLEVTRRMTDVTVIPETTTDDAGKTINLPPTTGRVALSYRVETVQGTSFSKDPSGLINVQNNGSQVLAFRPRKLPPDVRGWVPEFVVNGTWYTITKNDGGFFAPGEWANVYTSEPSNWPGSAYTGASESGGPTKEDTTGMKAPDEPPEPPIILDLLTSGLTPGRHYVKTALLAGEDEGPASPVTLVDVPPGYGMRVRRPLVVNKLENGDVGERKLTNYGQPRAWDIPASSLVVRNSISTDDASGGGTTDPIVTTPGFPVNDTPTTGGNTGKSPQKKVCVTVSISNFAGGKLNIVVQVFNSLGTLIQTKIVQSITNSVVQSGSSTINKLVEVELSSGTVDKAWSVDITGAAQVKVQVQKEGSVRTGGKSLSVSIGYAGVFQGGASPSPVTFPPGFPFHNHNPFGPGFPFFGKFPWPGFPFSRRPNKDKKRGGGGGRRPPKPPVPPDQPPLPPRPPQPPLQSPVPPPKPPSAPTPELIEQLAYDYPSGGYCHVVQDPPDRPRKEDYSTVDYDDFGSGTYEGWVPTNSGLGTIQQYLSANQNSFETDVITGIDGTALIRRLHSNNIADIGTHSMALVALPGSDGTDQFVVIGPVNLPDGGNYAWNIRVYCPEPTRINLSKIGIMEAEPPRRMMALAGSGFITLPIGWSTLSGTGAIPNDWNNNVYLRVVPASADGAIDGQTYDATKIVHYDNANLGLVYSSTINEVTTYSGMLSEHGLRLQKYADGTPTNFVTKTFAARSSVSVSADLYLEQFSGIPLELFRILDTGGTTVAMLQVLDTGNLRVFYRDAAGALVSSDYVTGLDNRQFMSVELSYDATTKLVQVFLGKDEYTKRSVFSTTATYTSTTPMSSVRVGGHSNAAPLSSRYTMHIGQIKITDLPTMPNSQLVAGNYIEYFAPDGTPQNAKYGPTGLIVPAKPNQNYMLGTNVWHQDMVDNSELFKARAKDKSGSVLQEYDSLVRGMSGDRERWERHTKQIVTPPGTAVVEFFANNLGGGKLRIHGLQMEEGTVATPFNSARSRAGSFSVYLNNRQPGMRGEIDPMVEISRIKRLRNIFVDGFDTATTSYSVRYRTGNSLAEIAGKTYTNDYTKLSVSDAITEVNIQMSSSVDGHTPEIKSVFLDVERPYAQLLRANGTEYNGGTLATNITTPTAPPNIEFITLASGGIVGTEWGSERIERISFTVETYRRSSSEEISYYAFHTLEHDNKRRLLMLDAPPKFTPQGKRIEYSDGGEYFIRETADLTAVVLKTEVLT